MRRVALALATLLAATAFATPAFAGDQDECVRVNQVRAFAADGDALIVRQGKSTFRRIDVAEGCPLAAADRIGFAVGNSQLYVQGMGGRFIPTSETTHARFCTATRHAYVTLIEDNEDLRSRCRITAISPSSREAFDAAGQVRDNRR